MTTVKTEQYRLVENALNGAAALLHRFGSASTNVNVDNIVETARKQTGLQDIGDEQHMSIFRHLVELLHQKEDLTSLARYCLRLKLLKATINRLKIEDYIQRHPEVESIPVKRPIFIIGFPRTGTTVLQNLLAQHPDRRALEFWELDCPVPTWENHPVADQRRRVALATIMLKGVKIFAPELDQMKNTTSRSYEECHHLFANTHAVLNYEFQYGLPAFTDEVAATTGMSWAYKEYKRMLQILLHQNPTDQLVLKCPEHLWFLDALLDVFPDACIIWPHRDPASAVPSYCSMMSIWRRLHYGRVDPQQLGKGISEGFHKGVVRAMESRKRHDPARFLDVQFEDIVHNKTRVLESVDQFFKFGKWDGWDDTVENWEKSYRPDKIGRHIYSAERYGFDEPTLRKEFEYYINAYGVAQEAPAEKHALQKIGSGYILSKFPALSAAVLTTILSMAALEDAVWHILTAIAIGFVFLYALSETNKIDLIDRSYVIRPGT